ncbi:Zn-dependent amino-or carboxypeptidase, M28 family [Algoriphagus locisalis]|uniref:Zn-dependent amino-or carboxypeptidase, M28 family n=1 Tax=Algoriphagus locisalis TaxID=305507 RepID=A0A1I6Z0U9_9BACT|nr:M28 family peptidase [Algoriphagus locisalis]SFT56312.1 Zn-dependent amino-or carboxypeptidase, M28 family [Algoriphagus locisalis]
MKKSLLGLSLLLSFTFVAEAQKKKIEKKFNERDAITDLTYLTSDELKGRDPASPEMALAYDYIALQLKEAGAKPVPGADGYFQNIPFRLSSPPSTGKITLGDSTYNQGENLLVLDGESLSGSYELVDVGFGTPEDFEGKDLTGKIAVSSVGAPDKMSPADLFALGNEKTANAKKQGAVALIERFNIPSIPWQLIANYLNRAQMGIDKGESSKLPYIWVKDLSNDLPKAIATRSAKSAVLEIEGKSNTPVDGKNVIAWIEGTDKNLKDEYVMLSAHYDHVGIGRPDAEGDSIYNGARDNAVGTVAVMNAAKFFAKNPPKRSVLLALWTAEEKGLLGSRYFAENPLIPLNQIIYNLNIDGAGYNDTSIITVIGLGRTTADDLVSEAVADFGLKAIADPAPEQGLYDRSDNVNFAKEGIPAPTFSLGFTAFDDEINKYYHKAGDEVDSLDLDYVTLYWKSYILAAQNIANAANQPMWVAGDKYEEAGKKLYGDK